MSQPFDRACKVPVPGEIDESLDEFWVGDPWAISTSNNLSGFERNLVYLNKSGSNFVDISYLTGADSDGDGRCVIPADLNNDGRQDLVVRQVGGGPLQVYENRFPKQHWLKLSLRGTKSNSLGIGAKVTANLSGRLIVRELHPINSYRSQSPSLIHFGLGKHNKIDSLIIEWPSGIIQEIGEIDVDRHILIHEKNNNVLPFNPGSQIAP
ncbi:MAG: hypothetical protein CMG75_01230 [Candidatus Marinimicrobia bacterium]|nr:hypothetical protein [Candidatus Neomarinimicrobiota bacterium]